MNSHREKLLRKIEASLEQMVLPGLGADHPGSFRGYTFRVDAPLETLLERFKQELEALSGHFHRIDDFDRLGPLILDLLQSYRAQRILAWDDRGLGLPWLRPALVEAGITVEAGDLAADPAARQAMLADLDQIKVGLTGLRGALADTGAVALVSGPGRSRMASLLPPVHIALLTRQHLYPSLPAFLADNPGATRDGSNLVFIAGPSRTGDIEMTLSLGVHGPKDVHVIVLPK